MGRRVDALEMVRGSAPLFIFSTSFVAEKMNCFLIRS